VTWTSRERMLAALDGQSPDHTPCAPMIFGALKSRCQSYGEFVERQVALGLDAFVELPPRPPVVVNDYYNLHGLPVIYDQRVEIREWVEAQPDGRDALMVKEYHTPAGALRTVVRQTADWRWGDHVPLFDDYVVPRATKFLVTGPQDIEPLRYLLTPLGDQEIERFRQDAQQALALARRHGLLVAAGWGGGADILVWLMGIEPMIIAAATEPQFMGDLLQLVADWNRQRLTILLDAGIDLYLKRTFYESTDFWSPRLYRQYLKPILRDDVTLAHQSGARVAAMMTTGTLPLVDDLADTGLDTIMGIDPLVTDLAQIKERVEGRMTLWGGLNGYKTIDQGTEAEVRTEVRQALAILGDTGRFILSPVENIRDTSDYTWRNALAMIDEWQKLTG